METLKLPWVFALVTAVWFGSMAKRSGRSATLWVIGGGAFGLVISALVLGLGRARNIPLSEHDSAVHHAKWVVSAAVLILIAGWLLTSSLHRQHVRIWKAVKQDPAPADPTPTKTAAAT